MITYELWDVILCRWVSSIRRFKGMVRFETSGTTYSATQRVIPRDLNGQQYSRENRKSRNLKFFVPDGAVWCIRNVA